MGKSLVLSNKHHIFVSLKENKIKTTMIEVRFENVCGTISESAKRVSVVFDGTPAKTRKFIIGDSGYFVNARTILKERINKLVKAKINNSVKYENTSAKNGNIVSGCAVMADNERMHYITKGDDMFILAFGNINCDIRSNVWGKVVNDKTVFVMFDVCFNPIEFDETEYANFSSRIKEIVSNTDKDRNNFRIIWKNSTKICFGFEDSPKKYLAEYADEFATDYDALYELNKLN